MNEKSASRKASAFETNRLNIVKVEGRVVHMFPHISLFVAEGFIEGVLDFNHLKKAASSGRKAPKSCLPLQDWRISG
jgi:hypothetical protein